MDCLGPDPSRTNVRKQKMDQRYAVCTSGKADQIASVGYLPEPFTQSVNSITHISP